jgi:nucleotide-binding universal stress UspA family protein
MTYRNILVHVDNSAAAKTRVTAAAALAIRFKCALTGVFLGSARLPDAFVGEAITPISVGLLEKTLDERRVALGNASAAARRMFDTIVCDAPIPFFWLDVENASDLTACARRHDLAILPPEVKPALGDSVITAAEVGMASGGPVLVLKHGGYPIEFGKKILVAWKDSREAARALRDALPFLAGAEEIHFLTVSRDGGAELDDLLQRHLHVHGCKEAKLVVERNQEIAVSDLIRRHVSFLGADMVVLGLYGHSRLQEMVLGGVSRELLHDMPMPLLVSH